MTVFGKERELDICLVGDNAPDYDLSNDEIFMPTTILINVSKVMDDDTAEVALFGESCYAEDGIMIAFKNGKYFGISGFDDCMNYFEDENFAS